MEKDRNTSLIIVCNEEGEWEGVYANGTLFTEGHSLSGDAFCALISSYECFPNACQTVQLTAKQLEKLGLSLPDTFEELKRALT